MKMPRLFVGWQRIRAAGLKGSNGAALILCDNLIYYLYLYNLIFLPAPVLILHNT